MKNRIITRIAKNVDALTSKENEIKKFVQFYNSCEPGSYIRMYLDDKGLIPEKVSRAIKDDVGYVS